MSRHRLAIDYGTSNTVAVMQRPDGAVRPLLFDGSPLLPSAVYAGNDGRLLVGRDAERGAGLDPTRFEPNPKRRINDLDVYLGDRPFTMVELIAAALRRVADEAVRIVGGPVGDVTITCPAAWGQARRRVLTDAAAAAGLGTVRLVPEPVAAASYFATVLGHRIPAGHCVVVYDLGAGTFDASVVRQADGGLDTLACRGVDDFGGLDLDAMIVERIGAVLSARAPEAWQRLSTTGDIADLRHRRMLWDDARQARETLSREPSAGVHCVLAEQDVYVTREEFETTATRALTRTVEVTVATLQEARIPMNQVAGWFLVGGASRTPLIATLLHRRTGQPPVVLEDPQIVVAEGALHASSPGASFPVSAEPGAGESSGGVAAYPGAGTEPVWRPGEFLPAGSASPAQPYSGQSLAGQPFSGTPFSGTPFSGTSAQAWSGAPLQQSPAQPFPAAPVSPFPAAPGQPVQGFPPAPAQPFPGAPAQPAPPFPGGAVQAFAPPSEFPAPHWPGSGSAATPAFAPAVSGEVTPVLTVARLAATPVGEVAGLLAGVPVSVSADLLGELEPQRAAAVLATMPVAVSADLLASMAADRAAVRLARLAPELAVTLLVTMPVRAAAERLAIIPVRVSNGLLLRTTPQAAADMLAAMPPNAAALRLAGIHPAATAYLIGTMPAAAAANRLTMMLPMTAATALRMLPWPVTQGLLVLMPPEAGAAIYNAIRQG